MTLGVTPPVRPLRTCTVPHMSHCPFQAVHVTSTEVNINFVNGLDHITDLNYTHTLCVDLLPQRVWSTAPSCESGIYAYDNASSASI
ncbi:hypothetical protein AAMO2058_001671800 [Amorphochlora amoebiformis]